MIESPPFACAMGGLSFFFSVDQNRHHLSAGDNEADSEEEQQVEHKLPEPDSRGAEVHGTGDGGTYLTQVSVVAGLLNALGAVIIIVFFVPYTASGFAACGKLFHSLFGVDYICLLYTSRCV